ncbi:hypothetical protein M446_0448 [Methylobacterium sp. 4-46]|nr:hypothetical protein M446_0448 [Methylobacterium sp. 4-46]
MTRFSIPSQRVGDDSRTEPAVTGRDCGHRTNVGGRDRARAPHDPEPLGRKSHDGCGSGCCTEPGSERSPMADAVMSLGALSEKRFGPDQRREMGGSPRCGLAHDSKLTARHTMSSWPAPKENGRPMPALDRDMAMSIVPAGQVRAQHDRGLAERFHRDRSHSRHSARRVRSEGHPQ